MGEFKTPLKFILLPIKQLFPLLILVLLIGATGFAQQNTPIKTASDSSSKAIPDTLLFRIEQVQNATTDINAHNKVNLFADEVHGALPDIKSNVNEIKNDVLGSSRIVDAKTLTSYQTILNGEQKQLSAWRDKLTKDNDRLREMSLKIIAFSNDSLLTPIQSDTSQKELYRNQLTDLRLRLQRAGTITTNSLDTVGNLLAEVSAVYFQINDIRAGIDERLRKTSLNAFTRESPYLWSAPPITTTKNVIKLFESSYEGQNHILSYFINNSWDNRVLLLFFGVLFFVWIFRNFKKLRVLPVNPTLAALKFQYIDKMPLMPALIVTLCLIPVFEPDSPPLYVQIVQLALLLVLAVYIRKRTTGKKFRFWLALMLLYVGTSLTIAIINYGLILRCWMIILNLISIYIGLIFYRNINRNIIPKKYLRLVISIYLSLHILAIVTNIFGRISLAKVFSQTAIVSLIQVVALAIMVHVISEAFELQIKISSISKGLLSKLDFSKVRRSFRKVLFIVALLLWLLVFFINLNFTGALFHLGQIALNKKHNFGSINYTWGDILLFLLIVYLANWLQKTVAILLGEGTRDFMGKTQQKSSKLALIRLIILIIGFFFAITASGVPIDKLTVVLGALSVGIGLGMQNIVNNFVSGIILIFEKPFQIGDFVELADKKGKVLDIGIRASTMLTQQGSEVIVPNGDLLSGRLTNWTLSNSYLRTEVLLKISNDADLELVKNIINEEVAKIEDAIKNTPVEIIFNSITADAIELRIQVWINSIYNEASFKGKMLEQLFNRFKAASLKIM